MKIATPMGSASRKRNIRRSSRTAASACDRRDISSSSRVASDSATSRRPFDRCPSATLTPSSAPASTAMASTARAAGSAGTVACGRTPMTACQTSRTVKNRAVPHGTAIHAANWLMSSEKKSGSSLRVRSSAMDAASTALSRAPSDGSDPKGGGIGRALKSPSLTFARTRGFLRRGIHQRVL